MRRALCLTLFASAIVASISAGSATTVHRHLAHRVVHKPVPPAGIGVVVDEAKMIALDRPAKTIYVGNPAIADISVVDARHAFVLGKTFGMTNLIALDSDGRQIANRQIAVVNGQQALTLNVGTGQYNFACTRGHCETMPRPGDAPAFVTGTESAITSHEDAAAKYAAGTGTGQPGQR